jgi:hypothetical protein
MLNRITSGWTWLETALNAMIDEINRQKPLGSTSIAVEESPNGALLKVTQTQQGQPGTDPTTPDGGKAGWQALTVVNPSDCSHHVIYYWGTPPDAPHP